VGPFLYSAANVRTDKIGCLGRHYVTASEAIYDARLATLWELPERPDHSIPMRAAAGAIRAGIHQKLVGGFNCRLGRK
jgi:hypothetical protein